MDCADRINIDPDLCLVPCEGIFADVKVQPAKNVTSERDKIFLQRYKNYKKFYESSDSRHLKLIVLKVRFNLFSDPSIEPDLKYIRIHIDTTTFDRVKKDSAAKFVDKLSAVGGTMGLLTGFSIISGVEILYFMGRIIYNFISPRKNTTFK